MKGEVVRERSVVVTVCRCVRLLLCEGRGGQREVSGGDSL